MTFPAPGANRTYQLFQYANTVTSDWFGIGALFTIGITIFMLLQSHGVKKAFVTSAFITMVFSVFFRILSLVNDTWVYLFIVLAGVSALAFLGRGGGVYD